MMEKKIHDRLTILRRRVAKVPTDPGVYRWLDSDGKILYVGKAKNLKNRMQTYVQDGLKRSPWTEIMVRQIADFDITVVRSELEALILEANIIKELQPKYNVLLKDDKGYVYVRATLKDAYPSIEVVRRIENDSAKYFGPFISGSKATEETLSMIDGIVHFRACKVSLDALNAGKTLTKNPCLDYQIGKCSGLCVGAVTQEEHRSRIDHVVSFFRGNFSSIKKRTHEEMQALAKEKKFERAARLRDVLRFIEGLEERQVVSDTSGDDADIIGVALRHGRVHVVLLRQRGGKVIEQLGFPLKGEAETVTDVLTQFLPQYYAKTDDIPPTIILSDAPDDAGVLEGWLQEKRGKSVKIFVPERGKKSKLLLMAERNAEEKVEQQFAAWEAETKKIEGALGGLQTLLGLPHLPRRIEGYDISHLGGSATVGSMVVMVNGKPKREHYRSFNMKTVIDGEIDDYRSLAETLRRRLKYLTDDLKTAIARMKAIGIEIGKARKGEQKMIEDISAQHSDHIGTDDIRYSDYVVARRDGSIIGFCRQCLYKGEIPMIRSLWIHQNERGSRLGHTLIRFLLSKVKKGKVYLHCRKESLVEYYAELGFQVVQTPPELLVQKIQDWEKSHPGVPPGMIMVYIVSKQKPDASFSERPDLLLIDGGKGQLSAVVDVLKEMHLDIPVAGLAKREEEIFVPGQPYPLLVKEGSEPRFLLQRLRDEAHRFANDRRERRLTVAMTASKLDAVPGIGDSTRITLLKKFGSTDAVISASDTALREVLSEGQVKALREMYP